MKKLVAAVACTLMFGCAGVNREEFYSYHPGDLFCGSIGDVSVWKRTGWIDPGVDCQEALALVRRATLVWPVQQPWDVYFTGGYAGFGVDSRMYGHAYRGMTYSAARVIVTSANPDTVEHEFHHAQDVEQGRPSFHKL